MVVTFKALLNERRQKADGTYPLVIRIAADRKLREIPLSIYLRPKDWDKRNSRVKPNHPNASLITQKIIQPLEPYQNENA